MAKKVTKKVCKKCQFGEIEGNVVECQRFPPSADGHGKKSHDTWPTTRLDDYCGEFKA